MAAAERVTKSKPIPVPGTAGTDGLTWNQFNVARDIQADLWANDKLSGAIELALLLWIWGCTWADRDVAERDRPTVYGPATSLKNLAKQLNTTADLVFRAIKRLRGPDVRIIATDPKDASGGKPLRLKLTPQFWHLAPAYKPVGLKVLEMPEPEDEADPEDDRQQILPGTEHLFAEPLKPAIIGVSRQVGKIRLETPDYLDVRSRWQGADIVLRVENKGESGKTIDLQVDGLVKRQKSAVDLQVDGSNTPAVERETLRQGLKCDRPMAERLESRLRAKRERAADFVAYVHAKNEIRQKPIRGGLLVTVLKEFLDTPAPERAIAAEPAKEESYWERRAREIAAEREAGNG